MTLRSAGRALAVPLLAVLAAAPAWARQDADPAPPTDQERFEGVERVTAVDLVVDGAGGLSAGDLEVTEGGEARTVVAVAGEGELEPWRLVVFFDLPLADPDGVRWAADALSERIAELVELGPVEIAVADPEPRTAMPPTRDAGALTRTLSAIAAEAQAGDELVRLRRGVARALAGGTAEAAPGTTAGGGDRTAAEDAELARSAAAEEARYVEERADALLLYLLAAGDDPEAGARRAVLLVTGGWDLDPAAYYRARLGTTPGSEGAAEGTAVPWPDGTRGATEELARTLAAYGWITLALAPPIPEEPEWHLRRRAEVFIDQNHRPEEGEAYIELGRSLAAQGELERAVDAFRDAIHAFYDHPASASRQALAEAELGDVLARMDRLAEAERWWRRATARDAELAARYPGAAAALAEPLAPLEKIADATAGRVVRHDPKQPGVGPLEAAIASLEDRVRVTYQRPGLPDGEVHPVTVSRGRGRSLPAPAWSRSGTPDTVAEARLRRLIDVAATDGADLAPTATLAPNGSAVALRLDPPAGGPLSDPDHRPLLRISLAGLDPDGDVTVRHRTLAPEALPTDGPWTLTVGAGELPADHIPAAVLVEDLLTGIWGAAVVTLPPARTGG